jgi:hypothetical protein
MTALEIKQDAKLQPNRKRLVKFKELQAQKVKFNDHDFEENDFILLKVENRHKLDPLGKDHMKLRKFRVPTPLFKK